MSDNGALAATKRSIRCGHCKGQHETVAEVRACFGRTSGASITGGQMSYAQALLRQRVPTEQYADMSEDRINAMSKDEASRFISQMKDQPFRQIKSPVGDLIAEKFSDIPEGYYAIRAADGTIDFYKLVEGKYNWALFQVYGSPGALAQNKVNREELARTVLSKIQEDPQAAMLLFGTELEICGACGSPLTNPVSREAGIGPICRGKRGW